MNESLKKRLAEYTAMAGFILANQNTADAQIIYHDFNPDDSLNNFNLLENSFYDLNGDGIYNFKFSGYRNIAGLDDENVKGDTTNLLHGYPLSNGSSIQNGLGFFTSFNLAYTTFSSGIYGTSSYSFEVGPWKNTTDKYLPVKLTGTGQTYFGWMRLDVDVPSSKLTVKDFAFNSVSGNSILAGDKGCIGTTVNPVITVGTGDTLISSPGINYQWQLNGDTIPGATEQSFEAIAVGEYSVVSTDANGCHVLSDVHHKGICPFFNTVIETDTSICYYDQEILLLDSVPSGYIAHWYKDGIEVNTGLTNQYQFIAITSNVFNAILENPINHCADTSNTISIVVNPIPVIDSLYQHNDSLICAINGSYSFYWSAIGSPFDTITNVNYLIPSQSYPYYISVTDSNGCYGHDEEYFYACYFIDPSISASSYVIGCDIDSVLLTVNSYPNVTNSWGSNTMWVTNAGNYDIQFTMPDANCSAYAFANILVAQNFSPPVIYQTGDTLLTGAYFRYQWFYNGVAIPEDTLFFVVTNQPIGYSVMVFNEAGCQSMSAQIVSVIDIKEQEIQLIVNESEIQISFTDKKYLSGKMKLYNMNGQLISEKKITAMNEIINIQSLSKGVYLLRAEGSSAVRNFKIIIQ